MKEFFPVLHTAALFSGISDDELAAMLSCLGARIDTFPKGSRLLRAGESVEEVGLVLAGSALIPEKATRDSAGVNVVTLKKNAKIARVTLADGLELGEAHRYRVRTLPAAGAILRADDSAEQLTL